MSDSLKGGLHVPPGDVTFLFTDIEESTRLWEQFPDAMRDNLARHDAILRATIQAHQGQVFKTIGDAFCAVFARPDDAIAAMLDAQRALQAEPWQECVLRVRMALNTGTAQARDDDYFGPTLNRVARLLGAGHGGQMLLFEATRQALGDQLPAQTSLQSLGARRLRGLQRPEPIFQLLHPDLPTDFPELRSLETYSHNLPLMLTSFVGRERETEEVKRLQQQTRLLTLTGSGGCGKTRLALQVGAEVVSDFEQGVWLVELASLADPALVARAITQALGLREEPQRPLLDTLTDYLRNRTLLLILDNCEHLIEACAQIAEHLLKACSRLRILASSRESLGIAGELAWQVPSLALPDPVQIARSGVAGLDSIVQNESARLFVERAEAVKPGFAITEQEVVSLAQVCRRLDGIPLAIELAAARVRVLSLEQIAHRLDDRFRLLTGGSRTALPRQQTLRAAIDWSYDLLTERERTLLRRLSVFIGGWTLEAAETVCSDSSEREMPPVTSDRPAAVIEEWEVLDLLEQLAEKSLVMVEPTDDATRYRLLETVRQYSRDRLLESGESVRLRDRHYAWAIALAERADSRMHGPEAETWLNLLDREHDNMNAALEWCDSQEGSGELCQKLAGALSTFWYWRGHFTEGRTWLKRALAHGKTSARQGALEGAAALAFVQGDYADAQQWAEENLAACEQQASPADLAAAYNLCGLIARCRQDYTASRAFHEKGLAIAQTLSGRRLEATARLNLGLLAQCEGDLPHARALMEQALELERAIGDKYAIALTLHYLGLVAYFQQDSAQAIALCREGLALQTPAGDRRAIFEGMAILGMALQMQGKIETAARLYGAVDRMMEMLGSVIAESHRPHYAAQVAAARAELGAVAFSTAWEAGRAFSPEQALQFALDIAAGG